MELGIGHILLPYPGHGFKWAEGERAGGDTTAITERIAVMVERHVQVPVTVNSHGYDIVGIGNFATIGSAAHRPIIGAEGARRKGYVPLGVVEAGVLGVARGGDGVGAKHSGVDRCRAIGLGHKGKAHLMANRLRLKSGCQCHGQDDEESAE